MTTDLEVLAYRRLPDPQNKRRDVLIQRYMGFVRGLAAHFVTPKHSYDDVIEFAYFELVQAVIRAKRVLEDNNIEPYINKCVRAKLLTYVTFDHLITIPVKSQHAWRVKRPRRRNLKDPMDHQFDTDESIMFEEILEKCVDDYNYDVVKYKLAGCTDVEVAQKTKMERTACQRLWKEFRERMKEYYGNDAILYGLPKSIDDARK